MVTMATIIGKPHLSHSLTDQEIEYETIYRNSNCCYMETFRLL